MKNTVKDYNIHGAKRKLERIIKNNLKDVYGVKIIYDPDEFAGEATTYRINNKPMSVRIGVKGMNKREVPIYQYISAGVAIFHEAEHCKQATSSDTDVNIALSYLAADGNEEYYNLAWNTMPHEIMAEKAGILRFWDQMRADMPVYANRAMLDYVNWRSKNTTYMIPYPEGGYRSRRQVEDSFNKAYDKCFTEEPKEISRLNGLNGDMSQVFDVKYGIRSPYWEHFRTLLCAANTVDRNRITAACSLQLHPEWQNYFQCLHDLDMSIETATGLPFSETHEETQKRCESLKQYYKKSRSILSMMNDISKEFEWIDIDDDKSDDYEFL